MQRIFAALRDARSTWRGLRRASGNQFGAYRLAGQLEPASDELVTLFAGHRTQLADLSTALYRGRGHIEIISEGIRLPKAQEMVADRSASLRIVESTAQSTASSVRLLQPMIDMCVSIPETFEEFLYTAISKPLRQEINKGRRSGFAVRFTSTSEALDDFYERMYAPTARALHGEWAHILPLETFRRSWDQAQMILAEREGQVVGGTVVLTSRIDGSLRLWRSGVDLGAIQDGRERAMVNTQMCAGVVELACRLGLKQVNFGMTPPVMNDGLYFYKQKWGCQAVQARDYPWTAWQVASDWEVPLLLSRPLLSFEHGVAVGELAFQPAEGRGIRQLYELLRRYTFAAMGCCRITLAGASDAELGAYRESTLWQEIPCRLEWYAAPVES